MKTTSIDSNHLLTINEAAKMMGVDIDTLRDWDRNGTFTSIRFGRGYRRYRLSDIQQFLNERTQDGIGELEAEAKAKVAAVARSIVVLSTAERATRPTLPMRC